MARLPLLQRPTLPRSVLPFAVVSLIAVLAILLPPQTGDTRLVIAAVAVTVAITGAVAFAPWDTAPGWAQLLPALAYLPVVAMLRESQGGALSAFGLLALLPIFWLALYGSRGQILVTVGAVMLTFSLPVVLEGEPNYPASEWQRVVLYALIGSFLGLTVQSLVSRLRDAELSLRMVGRVARDLTTGPDARESICAAVHEVSHAAFAMLLEPDRRGRLVMTEAAGEAPSDKLVIEIGHEPSGAAIAYTSKQRFFVPDAIGHPAVSQRLVKSMLTSSLLFEPVLDRSEAVGVLVVGWRRKVRRLDDRAATVIGLLADEAAVAMKRGDLVMELERVARTDPLTGLPNRRAWEEELFRNLARATRSESPLCVVLIDVDDFKAFNDAHGHLEGDRLLKETAASWRNVLRAGDQLARFGGDEFGAVLPDCEADGAEEIADRIRVATPRGMTCSAGIAMARPGDSLPELLARSDRALYKAKKGGRNRTVLASTA
jgi:diguanylate cyclase (GGDEF)-like protein